MYTDIFKKSNIQYVWIAAILILVYWVCSRFLAGSLKTQVETFEGYLSENNDDSIVYSEIPLDIYQTWKTKNLPPKMRECVENLKKQNPEFTHHLYDDEDCYEFIKRNFEPEVAAAYDSLIPGAYKADLWRYCILYKRGGVYLDIKYCNVDGFKLITLTNREHFTLDIPESGGGIYNAFMICLPGNKILEKCIHQIVKNVQTKYYGDSYLSPTGPLLMKNVMTSSQVKEVERTGLTLNRKADNTVCICLHGIPIMEIYQEYYNNEIKQNGQPNYGVLWYEKKIYKS